MYRVQFVCFRVLVNMLLIQLIRIFFFFSFFWASEICSFSNDADLSSDGFEHFFLFFVFIESYF